MFKVGIKNPEFQLQIEWNGDYKKLVKRINKLKDYTFSIDELIPKSEKFFLHKIIQGESDGIINIEISSRRVTK